MASNHNVEQEKDRNFTEVQLEACKTQNETWKCPIDECSALLSRKQTLKTHLLCIHGMHAGNPIVKYKKYDRDEIASIPRTTAFNRKRKLENTVASTSTDDSIQEEPQDYVQQVPSSSYIPDADLESVPMELSEDSDQDSASESSDSDSDIIETDTEEESDDSNHKADEEEMRNGPPLYVIPPMESVYQSRITVQQHLLSVCAFATKYNISTSEFEDLMSLLQLHIPENNLCETDVTKIKQECGFNSGSKNIHVYCNKCGALRPDDETEFCPTNGCTTKFDDMNGSYFVSTSIDTQMKTILERDGYWGKVQESHNRERSSVITDITDGSEYQKLREENGFLACPSNNITFTLFTDGIPLFKSSNVSLWPVYLIINELPPNERFLKKNMILWGLWQGTSKPKMNTFFQTLIVDLAHIYDHGVSLSINSQSVICKAMLVVLTMDLQARAYVLCMTQHNGEYGCIFCEHPGEMVKKGKGQVRAYPFKETPSPKRSDQSVRQAAKKAAESEKRVKGMYGRSVFMCLSYLSIVSSIVVDYMHGTLLGVTKKLISLWFETESREQPFYLGSKVKLIDQSLKRIKPPYCIHRLPRKIENNFNHWKASEFRSWLLFYSLPCLKGHLPDIYLEHYGCLVEAIYILLGDCISRQDLTRARFLLEIFVKHFATCYGVENMGQNIHNLGHLVDCVEKWGPLWTYSCFGFESFNGEILKTVHGTGNVCNQIFWSLHAQKHLEIQATKLPKGEMKTFFKSMLKGQSHQLPASVEAYQCCICKPLTPVTFKDLEQEIKEQLSTLCSPSDENEEYKKSKKMMRHEYVFYSKDCSRVKKRNSFTVRLQQKLQEEEDVVQVLYYLLNNKRRAFAICDTFVTTGSYITERMLQLQKVEKKRTKIVVPCQFLLETLVYIEGTQGTCVLKMPNVVEKD